MSLDKKSLNNEERREQILGSLSKLISKYPDYKNDIDDLIFYFEEKQLGNSQAFLLRIGDSALRIKRNENESELLNKLEEFLNNLLQDDISKTQKEVKEKAIDFSNVSLVEGKNKTYWRDITPMIIQTKHVFLGEKLSDEMSELRENIHNGRLGKQNYSLTYNGLNLDIEKGDGEELMLEKLAIFFKKLSTTYKDKFDALKEINNTGKDFNKDRKKAWAVILANLNDFRGKFKGEALGLQISELRDLINNFMLGTNVGYSINQDGIILDIKKGDNLDAMVEKILIFIESIQTKYPNKFKVSEKIDANSILKNKEEDKFYWRDTIAGIDLLQKKYTKTDYPVIEKLKEMLENNKLGFGSNLYFNVGGVILEIENTDSEKSIKNKISVFIGILKQLSTQEDEKNKLNETFRRDIEAGLRGFEDAYGNNVDYQMLIMLIESGTLGTVKDFKAEIEGININIVPSDSDALIKQKLVDFINGLKAQKKIIIDNKKFSESRERIKDLEKNMIELDKRYQKATKVKDKKIDDLEEQVRIYEQELKKLKSSQQQSQAIPKSYSRPSWSG